MYSYRCVHGFLCLLEDSCVIVWNATLEGHLIFIFSALEAPSNVSHQTHTCHYDIVHKRGRGSGVL